MTAQQVQLHGAVYSRPIGPVEDNVARCWRLANQAAASGGQPTLDALQRWS